MADRWDVVSPRAKKDGGTYWHRVGTAFQGDKGISIVFDSVPLPDAEGRVRVNLFESKPRANAGGYQKPAAPAPAAGLDDEIPF